MDVVLLEQEPSFAEEKSVLDNIFFHNHPIINAIKEYELMEEEGDPDKLSAAIINMDDLGAWDFDAKVKQNPCILLVTEKNFCKKPLFVLTNCIRFLGNAY